MEKTSHPERALVRQTPKESKSLPTSKPCQDCKAFSAFQYWNEQTLSPSFNVEIQFSNLVNIPTGKRAVIELVTATIEVPSGESARLRMFTSLGSQPSNLDLTMDVQSAPTAATTQLVATHSLRVYSDHDIEFNVNRDNATTIGSAIVCISGYIADQ